VTSRTTLTGGPPHPSGLVAGLTRLARRRWRILVLACAVLGGAAALAALAGPHLRAWYHWRAALADMERCRNAEARDHLDACLAVWPRSAAARLLAARTARRAGDLEAAAEHLQQCEGLDQSAAAEVTLEWALLHVAGGDLSTEVEKHLLTRAEKEPARAPLILEALAEGYTRMCRIREGFACVERWLALQPDNVQALLLRGNIWRQIRRLQKAVPDYQRVLELDPERDEVRWWLALGQLETGRYAEAQAHLEYLRDHGRDDADLRVRLAVCDKGQGRLEKARHALDAVLAEVPGHPAALRARGELELEAGRPERAEGWLRQAVGAAPYDYRAQFLLYQSLRQQEREEEAGAQKATVDSLKERNERLDELMTSKMSARPRDPALCCEVGNLLMSLGQSENGENWLLTALTLASDYGPAHAALARYYRERGDEEKAAAHAEQAQAATPKTP
jgi:tetratricopeptide (TPR) repeat protein